MFNWMRRFLRLALHRECSWREVVLYTRQGCHLCDDAWLLLEKMRDKYGYSLQQVDVDEDVKLQAEYAMEVPVVTVNGRVRFRGRINLVLLERLLWAESK